MKKKRLLLTLLTLLCFLGGARAQQALPYEYGFENNDLTTDGWTATDTSSGINSNASNTGSYGFRFSYEISSDAYLVSPILTGGTYGVDVSFYYKAYNSGYPDHFKVGYTTNESADPSEFTYGDLITSTTSWTLYENTFPAGTVRIAILYDADNYDDGWYLYLDDFSFTAASPYVTPTGLTATDVTTNAATISWTASPGEVTGYAYQYKKVTDGDGGWSAEATVATTSVALSGLAPGTTYNFRVKALYGSNESVFATIDFTTDCPETYSIPYAYGFEDAGAIDCWTLSAPNNSFVDTVDPAFARTGNNFFFFNYTEDPPQYLISPQLSGIENGLHVEFYYSQYTNGVETFKVGYSTIDNDPANFTWGDEITASTSYQRFSANYPKETKYVAIQHTSDDQYYLFIDDVLFEEAASVLEPTGLAISDETTTGATLSWTAGSDETKWDIYVTDDIADVPDDDTTPTVAGTSTKPYDLTGLSSCTIYYAYVRAVKGSNKSAWSTAVVFHTECEPIALPYSYDFDDDELPISWNTVNTNTSYCSINLINPSGSGSGTNKVLAFYRGSSTGTLAAVLPEVDVTNYPLNGYQISFDACCANSSSGKLGIGIMTDPTDFSTFQLIEEVDITAVYSTYGNYTVMLHTYTGTGRYIAIQDIHSQNGYVLVDNIEVSELPACIPPTGLEVTAKTATTTTLSWTAATGQDTWQICLNGDEENLLTVNANPYTLTGLTALTDYTVKVRAYCSSSAQSSWSDEVNFKTGAEPVTSFPWTEDFNSLTEANSIPAGWDNDEGTTTGIAYKWCYNTSTSGNGATNGTSYDESNCIRFNSYGNSSGMTNFLKTPPIALPDTPNMQLTFWYKNPTGGDFSVYISTDGGATHETALATGLTGVSSWTQVDPIYLSAYAGQEVVIVFKGTSNWGNGDAYIYLDDVTVEEVPSCAAPNGLTATNITTNSARLSWTANSGESKWTLYYKKTSDATYTEVADVTENPYTLTGLEAGTIYEYYVTAICSITDESVASNVYSFTTKCDPVTAFPWSEDFDGIAAGNFAETGWVNEHIAGTSTSVFKVITGYSLGGNDTHILQLPDQNTGNMTKLMLPEMTLPNTNYQFSIDVYRNNSYNSYTNEGIRVFVSDDGEIDGATELAFIPRVYSVESGVIPAEEAVGWYTYDLPINMDGTCYIILRGESYYGAATYMDNFVVSEIVSSVDITMNSFGIMTYASPYKLDYSSVSGLKAYAATAINTDGDLTMTQVNVAPRKAGLLLKGDPGTYSIPVTNAAADDLTDNKLVGLVKPTAVTADYVYILANGTQGVNWYPLDPSDNTIGANKAYLQLTAEEDAAISTGARGLNMIFEDATGIGNIFTTVETGAWYTLQGLRLDKKPTTKGVYIHNGKKVVIK